MVSSKTTQTSAAAQPEVTVMVFNRLVENHCDRGPEARSLVATSPFMVIALSEQRTVLSDDPADRIKRYTGFAVPVGAVLRNIRYSDVAAERLAADPKAEPTHTIGEFLADSVVPLCDGKPSSNDSLKAAYADWLAEL